MCMSIFPARETSLQAPEPKKPVEHIRAGWSSLAQKHAHQDILSFLDGVLLTQPDSRTGDRDTKPPSVVAGSF